MAKKRGLAKGRGLDALLGSIKKEKQIVESTQVDVESSKAVPVETPVNSANSTKTSGRHLTNTSKSTKIVAEVNTNPADDNISLISIDVTRLQSGKYQPRRDMNEAALAELSSSISQHGVMQPIVIRPLLAGENKESPTVTHEIIAGERRWRAAKMAGEKVIPAIERALSDELAIALALIENIQREDLSVIEQAAALQRFHTEFGMSHAMIADVVGKARTTVSNLLRLNALHDRVKDYLANGLLDMGHARALLPLSSGQQPVVAKKIIDQKMTVRDAEKLVKSILNPAPKKTKRDLADARELEKINQQLSDKFGAKVKLKQKKSGKGSVEIFFHDQDELASLLEQLQHSR